MDRHDRAVIDLGNIRDYIEDLKRERDEARAEIDRLRGELTTLVGQAHDALSRAEAAEASVERLRAAQQLPDVAREGLHGQFRVEDRTYWFPNTSADWIRRAGLDRLAIAALLDAETADTSSDDEACARCGRLGAANGHEVTEYDRTVDEIATSISAPALTVRAVLDAHRARGGQEEDRG